MPDIGDELEQLRRENARLRRLLQLTEAEASPARGTQAAWFDKAPGPVDAQSSPSTKVEFYAALFGARRDVYAVRWESTRRGTSGWMLDLQERTYEKLFGDRTIAPLVRLGLIEAAADDPAHRVVSKRGEETWSQFVRRGGQYPDDLTNL